MLEIRSPKFHTFRAHWHGPAFTVKHKICFFNLTSDGNPVRELPVVLQREHLLVLQRPDDELRQ